VEGLTSPVGNAGKDGNRNWADCACCGQEKDYRLKVDKSRWRDNENDIQRMKMNDSRFCSIRNTADPVRDDRFFQ